MDPLMFWSQFESLSLRNQQAAASYWTKITLLSVCLLLGFIEWTIFHRVAQQLVSAQLERLFNSYKQHFEGAPPQVQHSLLLLQCRSAMTWSLSQSELLLVEQSQTLPGCSHGWFPFKESNQPDQSGESQGLRLLQTFEFGPVVYLHFLSHI